MNTQSEPTPEVDSDNSFAHLATSIVAEQKEKEKRQLNLILHKVEESAEGPSNRKKDDISKATSLFSEYMGVETTVTKAIRIEKKGTEPRLLKVSVVNSLEVYQRGVKKRSTEVFFGCH